MALFLLLHLPLLPLLLLPLLLLFFFLRRRRFGGSLAAAPWDCFFFFYLPSFTEFYRVFFSLIGISSTNVSCPFRSIGPATGYCFIQFFIVSLWIVPKGATKLGKNEKKNPGTPKSATFFFWRKSAPLSETRPVPWVVVLRLLLFFFCGNFRQKKIRSSAFWSRSVLLLFYFLLFPTFFDVVVVVVVVVVADRRNEEQNLMIIF